MSNSKKISGNSLTDKDITTQKNPNRRAVLRGVGIGGLGLASTALAGCVVIPTGTTDADGGTYADPAGNGRGSSRTGLTDSDGGGNADAAGNGRRGW
jgi:hypothetical protein